jgi:hypothetical protein
MMEAQPRYVAGFGIRRGKLRGVAREFAPGGGLELWYCDHDHAPGVRRCPDLTPAQRAGAQQCALSWLVTQIQDGWLQSLPARTEDEDEAQQAATAIVLPQPAVPQVAGDPPACAAVTDQDKAVLRRYSDSHWRALMADLVALDAAGTLGGIRAVVAERLRQVRSGKTTRELTETVWSDRPHPAVAHARSAALLAAEIDWWKASEVPGD